MLKGYKFSALIIGTILCAVFSLAPNARAQQTLGGITGEVDDSSGGIVPNATVSLLGDQTQLARTQTTSDSGTYSFVNLPIGNYTLTFSHDSFKTQKIPSILVQANRTVTVNAVLEVGEVSTTVTVEETPLMNAVDTTNGYVLDKAQIEDIPLPTGSFTGIAVLSPGVNAELPGGTGANTGLGNAPIWANGQRDTSNTLPPEWCGREKSVQRQDHEPGGLRQSCEHHRRQHFFGPERPARPEQLLRLSRDRRGDPVAGSRNHSGSSR